MHWVIPILQALTDDEEPAAWGETVGFEAREAIKDLRFGNGWVDGFPSRLPWAKSFKNLIINPYEAQDAQDDGIDLEISVRGES